MRYRALIVLSISGLLGVAASCSDGAGGGGVAASGGTSSGGAPSGGAPSGGTSSGGASTGGSPSGGSAGSDAASGGAAGGSGAAASGGTGAADGSVADASSDAGVPLPGLGVLSGDCGPLDATEILSVSPFTFDTALDFGTVGYDYNALSPGGKKVFDDGNLGGSSIHSEIFSYEVLYRCELATLLKTEGEVFYTDTGGKKTDLLVQIDGYKVGVSVTRAYAYPPGTTFTVAMAQSLLEKKLADILSSSQNVAPPDAWKKQILHVLAYDKQHRDAVAQAYTQIASSTKADTILMVTVTDGNDAFMY